MPKAHRFILDVLEDRTVPTSLDVFDTRGANLLAPTQPGQPNAVWDGLTGAGVRVGVVEPGRVGKQGVDQIFTDKLVPSTVFEKDVAAGANTNNIDAITYRLGHATSVASVIAAAPIPTQADPVTIIGNQTVYHGLARGVNLLSAAVNLTQRFLVPAEQEIRATFAAQPNLSDAQRSQVIRDVAARHLRPATFSTISNIINYQQTKTTAINLSYLVAENHPGNGSGEYSLMLDYLTQSLGTLAVAGAPNPNDPVEHIGFLAAYNDISVAAIGRGAAGGTFDRLFSPLIPQSQTRSLVDIVAPGQDIRVIAVAPDKQVGGRVGEVKRSGSSFATPMVTSAVALLTEYVHKNPATLPVNEATHRLVMKAVLMNSADKIAGALPALDGKQTMLRTVLGGENRTNAADSRRPWEKFDAVKDEYTAGNTQADQDLVKLRQATPLNPEFGAGALNVGRALEQLKGGQGGSRNPNLVAGQHGAIGWDVSSMELAQGNPAQKVENDGPAYLVRKYKDFVPLKPGSYFSATLTWERPITMKDATGQPTTTYQTGTEFVSDFKTAPPNLNLYLMPKNATKLSDAVWASNSEHSSTEHFFFQIPNEQTKDNTGRPLHSAAGYELWVTSKETTKAIPYGIAWWGERGAAPENQPKDMKGKTFNDANGDGLQNPNESGRAGVRVALLDSAGTELDSVTTDYQGYYSFEVQDGSYQIAFSAPRGTALTTANVGTDDTVDSDADPTTGRTAVFTVAGADVDYIDAGLVALAPGTVSGRAFVDADNDGAQDVGEGGRAGVAVDLYTTDGEFVAGTFTDSNGDYTFSAAPGAYVLAFEQPTNTTLAPKDAASDAVDSDADPLTGLTSSFAVASNGALAFDVGLRDTAGTVAGVVYFDADADGTLDTGEEGVADQLVELRDSLGDLIATTQTEADGSYTFDEVLPGSYSVTFVPDVYYSGPAPASVSVTAGTTSTANAPLGFTANTALVAGRVWTDANANGVRDSGEPAQSGVTVELLATGTSNVIATATTDGTGEYAFAWIAPGTYDLRVIATHAGTTANAGPNGSPNSDDTIDSDFDPLTHVVSGVQVGAWGAAENVDAGLLNAVPVANNGNFGTLQNVALSASVASLTSDADGDALVVSLTTGPAHGTLVLNANGTFTYTPNTGFVGTDSFTYTAADGYGGFDSGTVTITVSAPTVTLTGRIWNDTTANGVQDAGEVGVAGVLIQLLDVSGNVLVVGYTNSNGDYSFANIAAGQYRLRVIPPPQAVFVPKDAGNDDSIDSDFDMYGYGDIISVPPGGSADADAGFWFGPGGGIQVGGV